ncbi:MAG: hypothetical protein L6R38_001466 [Xanthoria sp. 2 TBL-2021]|nr:MAG: hypothetical protein L6R38_001466 [Xanthoria sp. 2 TBL-2021]
MPSLTALAVLALSCAGLLSHASVLQREAADQNLKRQAPHEEWPAGELLPLPQKMKRQDATTPDLKAQIVLTAEPTKTSIRLTRAFLPGDLMADKNNAGIQEQLINLLTDAHSYTERQVDGVINGNRDPDDPLSTGWIFSKCNPHGYYKLQVANAHLRYGNRFSPTFPQVARIVGHEITWAVLRVALETLFKYMQPDAYGFTECAFEIWDGENQVGKAEIVKVDPQECLL